MSRSIRGGKGRLARLAQDDYADAKLKRKLIRQTEERIATKALIERRVRQTRHGADLDIPAFDADTIRIELVDGGPHRPVPLSADALRDLMRRFPRGALDGLATVWLRPAPPLALRRRLERRERDPLTQTPASQVLPGVWGPMLRGQYFEHDRSIHVYSHIHPAPPTPAASAYVKLRSLITFAHEASHHFDFMFRTRGDRWLMDHPRDEHYATRRAFTYVRDIVVPWLQETYPHEHDAFQEWALAHAGVPLPLALFADEHGIWPSGLDAAFDTLVESLCEGENGAAAKTTWALNLHELVERTDDAYRVLEGVLAAEPDHVEALAARAQLDCATGQTERAETTTRALLARVPAHAAAWDTLAGLLQAQRRWEELAAAATVQLEAARANHGPTSRALEERASAWLELQRWEPLAADIDLLRGSDEAADRAMADVFLAIMQCERGHFGEALALSVRLLEDDAGGGFWSALRAVRFESAHRLGRPDEAGALSAADLGVLGRVRPGCIARLRTLASAVAG